MEGRWSLLAPNRKRLVRPSLRVRQGGLLTLTLLPGQQAIGTGAGAVFLVIGSDFLRVTGRAPTAFLATRQVLKALVFALGGISALLVRLVPGIHSAGKAIK